MNLSKNHSGVIQCCFLICWLIVSCIYSTVAFSGISLNKTRIIYLQGEKQESISVANSSKSKQYLIQSWVENAEGRKTSDFIVTPPLFKSGAGDENLLQVISTLPLTEDNKEQLYYFNVKSIPALNKAEVENSNMLLLATVTRIKMFVRPKALKISFHQATEQLTFHRYKNEIKINNPSPYYLTLTEIKLDNQAVGDIMVPPYEKVHLPLSNLKGKNITYQVVNDFGGLTSEKNRLLK